MKNKKNNWDRERKGPPHQMSASKAQKYKILNNAMQNVNKNRTVKVYVCMQNMKNKHACTRKKKFVLDYMKEENAKLLWKVSDERAREKKRNENYRSNDIRGEYRMTPPNDAQHNMNRSRKCWKIDWREYA